MLELDFGDKPEKLTMYKRIHSEVISKTRLDENSGLSRTSLGRVDITRVSRIKAEERVSYIRARIDSRKATGWKECQILLDTGATKSLMSKSHYLHCKSLHLL